MQTNKFNLNVFLILLSFCSALILSACEEDDEGSSGGENMICAAAPVCAAGLIEVDSCEEGDESCQAETLCEQTIYCKEGEHRDHEDGDHEDGDHEDGDHEDDDHEDGDHEDDDHEDGDHEDDDHEDGDHEDDDHEDGDHEDGDHEDEVDCQAAPVCGPDQTEVEACEEGDESCEEVTICGQTIFCTSAE